MLHFSSTPYTPRANAPTVAEIVLRIREIPNRRQPHTVQFRAFLIKQIKPNGSKNLKRKSPQKSREPTEKTGPSILYVEARTPTPQDCLWLALSRFALACHCHSSPPAKSSLALSVAFLRSRALARAWPSFVFLSPFMTTRRVAPRSRIV